MCNYHNTSSIFNQSFTFTHFPGCYKAKLTINALHSLRKEFLAKGLEIKSINYNEPGGGKSRCDTFAAIGLFCH